MPIDTGLQPFTVVQAIVSCGLQRFQPQEDMVSVALRP
jgi:hypothetical protein